MALMDYMSNRSGLTVMLSLLALCVVIPVNGSCDDKGVPVLIYHQVLPAPDEPGETVISLEKFREQMRYLSDHGYRAITVAALVAFMKGGEVPEKSVVLTFDDGWKSMKDGIPVLKEYRFKASFWIFPRTGVGYPYLDWPEIRDIARDPDFEIGAHSMTHPWDGESLVTWAEGKTPGRTLEDAAYEVRESKKVLEELLQHRVPYFAWPKGEYNEELVKIAKDAGYEAVLTVEDGANRHGDDVFRIKRIFIDGACDLEAFAQTLRDYRYHACRTKMRTTEISRRQ